MKLLELELLAFGGFADKRLDFSRRPGALHIVYGPNEAGKSTCLRAVETLLFGFEHNTRDAHLHPTEKLRVGGRLEGTGGKILSIVRRKKQKGSLRGPDDEPVDEEELRAMLHGVDRALFRALYGLDHVRLREGARALLDARGGLGESLFEAGLAGAGVAKLSRALRDEADSLWSPTARKRPLAEALRAYSSARVDERRDATRLDVVRDQEQGIVAARARRDEADERLRELAIEERKLQRARQLVPRLKLRRAALEDRAGLGEVVLLAEGARAEREAALATRAEANSLLAQATSRAAEIRAAIAAQGESPCDVDEAQVRELASTLGEVRRELRQSEALVAEAARLDLEMRDAPGEVAGQVDERATLAAVRERDALDREVAASHGKLAAVRARLAQWTQPAPDAADHGVSIVELERAIEGASRVLARGPAAMEAHRRAGKHRAALVTLRASLPGLPAQITSEAPVPADADVARWAREVERLESALAAFEREHDGLAVRRVALERDKSVLLATGDVPTEAQLQQARRDRDVALSAVRGGDRERLEAVIDGVRAADEIADRLRREVERATKLAAIVSEVEQIDGRAAAIAGARADARRDIAAAHEAARAAFVRAGVDPPVTLDAAPAWLSTWRAYVIELAGVGEAEEQARSFMIEEKAAATTLAALRGGIAEATLEAELGRARTNLEVRQAASRERSALEQQIRDARSEEVRLTGELAESERVLDALRARAASLVGPLGLDVSVSVDQVSSRLAELTRGRQRSTRRAEIAVELETAARATKSLERLTERAGAAAKLTLQGTDVVARAEALLGALETSRRASEARRGLDRQLAEQLERAHETNERIVAAESTLAALAARASVVVAELAEAETRSSRARELDAAIRGHEETILALGDGASIDELEAELSGLDVDQALERLDAIVEARTEAERLKDAASHDIASLGLARFEESQAADHAALAEQHMARARPLFDRYVRLRMAATILEREIESYSRENQGPVLSRAAELFQRLTENSFHGLKVVLGDGDRPELVCMRGKEEVDVEALSDGTRDQLYLALRLATIERHASRVEAMPLVLDDILVHFDDPRSRAALAALADISPTVQVLLFTHHARIVELAREVVPRDRLGVVTLGGPPEDVASLD
ncbi:MAG: AAA family ATPase [Polyangiaceae bacterium]|nr:AAA family ATPase [Polyangiaceae bacterium]